MAIIVADLIAQLRVQDSGVEQSLDRTRSNLQQVGRQAENTGRATQQMSSASAAAYSRAQAASTRLRMAEQQLADARRAGNTPTQRLMSLEARVHSARAGAITAAQRYASSQNQIAQANQNVERSNRAVERSSNSVVAAAGRARGALEMAGVGVGLAAVVEGMKRAVFAASDLAESTNAVDVSFGSSAQKVKDWAATAAQAIGQSNVEAREGASTMALYGKQANLSGDSLANFSIKMTTLASDMASFRNTSPEQAVEALGAAFRGESDPIEAYGVLLNEATIKNQAMKDGLVASTSDALTPAIRVQAVYNAILEQTSIMQGDFGNTSDSMANRLRILRASATNAAAGIGDKLMPIANGFITLLEGPGMAAFQGAGSALGAIGSVASMVGAAFGDLPGPIQSAIMAVVAMRIAQRLLGGQMQSLQQRVAGVGGAWQGYSQRVANVQRAASLTGQSMGRLQASTIAMGQTVRNASPTLMSMQAAFLRASSAASTMPRTAGAFSAATTGMAAGARGLIGALGGPWGLAIMGATIALGAFIKKKQEDKQKSQEAAAQTESWADQIGRAGGKITSALRTDVLKQADDDTKKLAVSNKTLAQTMTDLGFSNKDTVDTILKQGDAYERVRNRLIAMQNDRENSDQDTRAAAYDARLELERLAKQADDAKTKAQRLAQANGDMRVSFDKNNTAVGAMTEAMTEFEESTDGAASKVDKLAKALSQLNSDGQTEEEAQQSWSDSIRDLAKALGEAGTAAVLANGKIDFTTEKGSALQDAVQKQAEAFNQVAAAAFEAARAQGKSIPEAVELARTKLVEQRKALIDSLTAQGLSADAARRLADAYGLIPNQVATNLNVVGLDEANAGVGTLLVQLNTLPREKPVTVNTPGGRGAFDLLRSIGAQVREGNNKQIEVTSPMAPAVLDLLHRLGLAVRTNNGKTIVVTDNGTAAVVQRNIDAIRGHQVRMTVTYVDAAGREVRGIDPSTGGIPLKPEYFKELKPKGKATGGPIVGPGTGTSDDVPLWGSNGEFMMQAAAVKRYGLSFMHAVNAQRLATGGPVGSGPAGGDAAAVSDPGTATVAVPGMGLRDALGRVAATVSQVKDSQLDPAMAGATAGVTEYGLATAEQTAAVQAAWTATGSAVTTAAGNVIGPAVRGVGQLSQSTVAGMVVPALAGMRSNIAATAMGMQTAATGQINPAIASVGSTVQGVHAGTVDPVLAAMRGAVGNTAASFGTGASAIAAQWNSVREATAAPVRFTIGTVFNNGLVGMWNSVADLIGTSKMNPYPIGFATGGVLPGYTPGRDVHQFASPTGGRLALSGGEAIMRPEWTRAVGGPNAVNRMNALARSGQLRRVKGTDQYLGGDMAFASGGTIQGGSSITSEIQRTMWDAVRTAFPNVILTSGTRYADVGSGFDNHMGQRALDLAGPMPEIARWIYQLNRTQPVEELIHWPLQGWQNLKAGSPLDYGAGTNADHCVPLDVEILTRRGWLTHDQLRIGDETPGFNPDTGRTEWTKVTGIQYFDDVEVLESRSNAWSVRSTRNHRWVAREAGQKRWGKTTTEETGRRTTWLAAAPMADGPGLDITADEAELLGWLVTDGSQWEAIDPCAFDGCGNLARSAGLCGSHRRQARAGRELTPLRAYPRPAKADFSMFVWQTKPMGVERLGELLGDRAAFNGKGYRISDAYARDLLTRLGITHIKDAVELLAALEQMTQEQREAMLAGVVGGDGTNVKGRHRIYQDEGPLIEVITTLAYFCGHRPIVHKRDPGAGFDGYESSGVHLTIHLARPHVSPGRQPKRSMGRMRVWCPTTELSTWTARFDDNVVLTSNSDHVHWAMAAMRSFAGRLVSMAGGSGGPAIQKSMSQIIAETLNPLRAQVEKSMAGAALGGQMGQLPRGVFTTMQQAMTARLQDLATKYMGPAIGGGADVERWRPMVIAALRRNGFEPNKRNQDLMLAQIGSESGGNPGVVQGVQDVNSGGNEAVGLLQVTPGTFATHRDPSLSDNRSDPWANMNAALRYYRARYGDDLGAMWGKGHGYANGGTIPGVGNRDTVPILTTPGEEVIRKGPAEKNRPLLKKINEGGDVRVYVTNWPAGTSYSSTAVPAVPADPNADPMVDPAMTITDPTAVEPAVSPSERSAAENLVANAKRKHTEAVNRQRLAELKLAEIQGNPKAKASQREAAEQAVAKAKNDVIAATEKQRLAEQKLAETVSSGGTVTPGMPGATGVPTGPPTAFELKLRNPFQPFWWRGEKEYQERIIQRARELEQAQNELNGSGSGAGSGTSLSSVLGSENAVAERKRVLEEAEGKLRIAQMKLQEVQGSKNPKPSQIESARQAVTRAENDVTKAREDLAVAEQKLAENQAKPVKQPGITKMWVGGTVPGTGISDTVPALLTPGEEVTRRAMAIKHRRLLKAINADKVGRYASGGTAGFGGYSADDSDYMKPTSLYDWLALGVGGASSVAGMAAPYAQMLLTGQVDLGNAMPQFDTGANDPTGGFANSVISDFASQISQQLNELIRAVKEGQDIHVKVENDQSPSAAGLVGMAMGV
ncbi:tape measure protein [Gordonia phage Mcklovin]|uniref:Tape measure protein n=1 Tax=Gordonia phage Mcklovin TaxID=2652881 RepID=A0A5P8DCT5_9CAUD|nr:tail length tape measure protein [Gordonia phage Mcklovin]QFP96803.1 tape measure protein [Gordonia phage Mcklovin]